MAKDPIIQDIHRFREEYARQFGNDLLAIVRDARAKQGHDGRKVVEPTPRPASNRVPEDTAA